MWLCWDQGAGNSGKAPQRCALKLELSRRDVCQEGRRVKAEGTVVQRHRRVMGWGWWQGRGKKALRSWVMKDRKGLDREGNRVTEVPFFSGGG